MYKFELNQIPEKIYSGQITEEQALHELVVFLNSNWAIFNLHKRDEDFKSDIILNILEKGNTLFVNYRPEAGTFFNYFYSYVKSAAINHHRIAQKNNLIDNYNYDEAIKNYDSELEHNSFDFIHNEKTKVPFSYKPVNPVDFQIACKTESYRFKDTVKKIIPKQLPQYEKFMSLSPSKIKKILIILALKSSYYISDVQVEKIAEICDLNSESLKETIHNLRSELEIRIKNRKNVEFRRNKAYFNHKKYQDKLLWLKESDNVNKKYILEETQRKYLLQTKNWIELNRLLSKGYINIRPSNKAIASIIGICERQVSYYIKNAKEFGFSV